MPGPESGGDRDFDRLIARPLTEPAISDIVRSTPEAQKRPSATKTSMSRHLKDPIEFDRFDREIADRTHDIDLFHEFAGALHAKD